MNSEEIAIAAARLVVDDGMEYGAAKLKAARSLGRRAAARGRELPSNEAVEDEVRTYLEVFGGERQRAELRALRRLALQWMERLAEFRPHLGGTVWRGTATRQSAIHLDLYCDDPKAAELSLLDRRIAFDVHSRERPGAAPVDVLSVATPCPELGEPVTLFLTVLDHDDLRGALRADARGRSWRGDAAGVRRLLDADEAAP